MTTMYEPKRIGPGAPCYYDATPMLSKNDDAEHEHSRRLECPTCGLVVLYNIHNGTWLRIKDRRPTTQ